MGIKKYNRGLLIVILVPFIAACGPVPTVWVPPTPTSYLSPTPTPTLAPSATNTPTSSPTQKPLTLLFYGDSASNEGDVNQALSESFSFVDLLRSSFPSKDQVVVNNHAGQKARWAYEHLDENVLNLQPDLVTLWWGMNDLGGCPGVFDRDTNRLLEYQVSALLNAHIYYLRLQIDAMLEKNITVFVMTPIPVLGTLPWNHFTEDNLLVWENDHRCDFNTPLQQLVEAQRSLVAGYSAAHKPVYLVDAWQVYKDHPNTDKMYMDIFHPASNGSELIAAEWLRVFRSIDIHH